jgi:hypothetical protein
MPTQQLDEMIRTLWAERSISSNRERQVRHEAHREHGGGGPIHQLWRKI